MINRKTLNPCLFHTSLYYKQNTVKNPTSNKNSLESIQPWFVRTIIVQTFQIVRNVLSFKSGTFWGDEQWSRSGSIWQRCWSSSGVSKWSSGWGSVSEWSCCSGNVGSCWGGHYGGTWSCNYCGGSGGNNAEETEDLQGTTNTIKIFLLLLQDE